MVTFTCPISDDNELISAVELRVAGKHYPALAISTGRRGVRLPNDVDISQDLEREIQVKYIYKSISSVPKYDMERLVRLPLSFSSVVTSVDVNPVTDWVVVATANGKLNVLEVPMGPR